MKRGTLLTIGAITIMLGILIGEQYTFAADSSLACDNRIAPAAKAFVSRGDMAISMQSLDVAVQEYQKALAAAPATPAILYRLAIAYANSQNEIGAILYLRAYIEAASASRNLCVPVPVKKIWQIIQDLETKVEIKSSLAFQAAIEAIGTVPEGERTSVAKSVVQSLASAERWRQAESVARQYPLDMTEAVTLQASIMEGPLRVRMFDLAKKLALIDPPDRYLGPSTSRIRKILLREEGESDEEFRARERKEGELDAKRDEEYRQEYIRDTGRLLSQALRLLLVAVYEGGRCGWHTIIRSQEMLAKMGNNFYNNPFINCQFKSCNILPLSLGQGGEVWCGKAGLVLKFSLEPGKILWSRTFVNDAGLPVPIVSKDGSCGERPDVVAAGSDKSAVSECTFNRNAAVKWLDLIQGRLKDAPRWSWDWEDWKNDRLFVDFPGWVQELKTKTPAAQAEELSKGGLKLIQALENLRACGGGGQR